MGGGDAERGGGWKRPVMTYHDEHPGSMALISFSCFSDQATALFESQHPLFQRDQSHLTINIFQGES